MALVMSTSSALACEGHKHTARGIGGDGTDDGHDDVCLLGEPLKLVEIGEGADDGVEAELGGEAARLFRRTDVECDIQLIRQAGRCEDTAEEGAADVS